MKNALAHKRTEPPMVVAQEPEIHEGRLRVQDGCPEWSAEIAGRFRKGPHAKGARAVRVEPDASSGRFGHRPRHAAPTK